MSENRGIGARSLTQTTVLRGDWEDPELKKSPEILNYNKNLLVESISMANKVKSHTAPRLKRTLHAVCPKHGWGGI